METTKIAILEAFADQIVNNPNKATGYNANNYSLQFQKTIDGIDCYGQMHIDVPKNKFDKEACHWTLIIRETRTNKNIYRNYKNYMNEYTKECIMDNIKKCVDLVNSLYFNIILNRLIKKNNNVIEEIKNNLDQEKQNFAEVLFAKDDDDDMKCSVCLEITTNTLACAHHLCMACIHKMKRGLCPLCRRSIHSFECDCDLCSNDWKTHDSWYVDDNHSNDDIDDDIDDDDDDNDEEHNDVVENNNDDIVVAPYL